MFMSASLALNSDSQASIEDSSDESIMPAIMSSENKKMNCKYSSTTWSVGEIERSNMSIEAGPLWWS